MPQIVDIGHWLLPGHRLTLRSGSSAEGLPRYGGLQSGSRGVRASVLALLPWAAAAGCAPPRGSDPNSAFCQYTLLFNQTGGPMVADLHVRCDPAPKTIEVSMKLEYRTPLPGQPWRLKATGGPDHRIPGSNGIEYTVATMMCLVGPWRVTAHVSGTDPDGSPMTPPPAKNVQRTTFAGCF